MLNNAQSYHGSQKVTGGRLTGTTDTDYFYFFCPDCGNRQVMRILDYGLHFEEGGAGQYPEEPKQPQTFVIALKLYCPACKLTDHVKIGNTGWQGGRLPE